MTEKKNFSGQTTPKIKDTEYRNCNFSQPDCVDDAGKMRGVRIFPGDDTPRTFIGCNMVNCEPPLGSTQIDCNNAIVRRLTQIAGPKQLAYGKYEKGKYLYFPTPKETLIKVRMRT